MKKACLLLLLAITCMASYAQEKVSIQVDAQKTDGYIDELLYGQLFEHIYFSANNGVWQEISWKTIWSTSGSASEVIYPYWWHFIYGGL